MSAALMVLGRLRELVPLTRRPVVVCGSSAATIASDLVRAGVPPYNLLVLGGRSPALHHETTALAQPLGEIRALPEPFENPALVIADMHRASGAAVAATLAAAAALEGDETAIAVFANAHAVVGTAAARCLGPPDMLVVPREPTEQVTAWFVWPPRVNRARAAGELVEGPRERALVS